jgi:hypothetical protein
MNCQSSNIILLYDDYNRRVATRIEHESETPAQNSRNRTVGFLEPDSPVLSRPTTIRRAARLRRDAPPPAKWRLNGAEAWTTTTLEVVAVAKRSNWRENEKNKKIRAKVWKNVNSIDLIDDNYNRLWPMYI